MQRKSEFGEEEIAKADAMAKEIIEHAKEIVVSDYTFVKMLNGR